LREQQVLDLLSQDLSLQCISAKLGVSYVTVRNHVQHILAKFGAHSILEAVALYLLVED
jgi:DNA-binding CsgD family transcriptional regulator